MKRKSRKSNVARKGQILTEAELKKISAGLAFAANPFDGSGVRWNAASDPQAWERLQIRGERRG